jgi:hypothetical protein
MILLAMGRQIKSARERLEYLAYLLLFNGIDVLRNI